MTEEKATFKFDRNKNFVRYYTCDIDLFFKIKIDRFAIPQFIAQIENSEAWYYLECAVVADCKDICCRVKSRQKPQNNLICNFNELIIFPIMIKNLPKTAKIEIKAMLISPKFGKVPLAHASSCIFNEKSEMNISRQIIFEMCLFENFYTPQFNEGNRAELSAVKMFLDDAQPPTPYYKWLDSITLNILDNLNESIHQNPLNITLTIFFQDFECDSPFVILYHEQFNSSAIKEAPLFPLDMPFDPGFEEPNLVEEKHNIQVRSLRDTRKHYHLKPTSRIRTKIETILKRFPTNKTLAQSENDILWTYRYSLIDKPEALAKFLLSVDWSIQEEVDEALNLMSKWVKPSPSQALELLSHKYSDSRIKSYALSCLCFASDDELGVYLFNLVLCLSLELEKNEFINNQIKSNSLDLQDISIDANLTRIQSLLLPINDSKFLELFAQYNSYLENKSGDCLLFFLFKRCSQSDILSNFFYWYLKLASLSEEKSDHKSLCYCFILDFFSYILLKGETNFVRRYANFKQQTCLLTKISSIGQKVKNYSNSRKNKILMLQSTLASDSSLFDSSTPSPINPKIKLSSCISGKCSIFNSVMKPIKFAFSTDTMDEYCFIYKSGDDLRQDQVILTMINIMNKILMDDNIDSKLTPYFVLALSPSDGLIEYVPSITIADILSTFGTIQNYFKSVAYDSGAPYEIAPFVLENYVKSCAGYSVITYLLGIGDRHLDNLLLTLQGKLFHIDFAYILGSDPKPYPPSIKFNKEMVEGMGGLSSKEFEYFLKLCSISFIHLRRQSNIIINAFSLLVHSDLGEISSEPDKAVRKLEENFRLDLNDSEAQSHLMNLIFESINAVFSSVVETIHKIAQIIRR